MSNDNNYPIVSGSSEHIPKKSPEDLKEHEKDMSNDDSEIIFVSSSSKLILKKSPKDLKEHEKDMSNDVNDITILYNPSKWILKKFPEDLKDCEKDVSNGDKESIVSSSSKSIQKKSPEDLTENDMSSDKEIIIKSGSSKLILKKFSEDLKESIEDNKTVIVYDSSKWILKNFSDDFKEHEKDISNDDNEIIFVSGSSKVILKKSPEELEKNTSNDDDKTCFLYDSSKWIEKKSEDLKGKKRKIARRKFSSVPAGSESDLMADLRGKRLSASAGKCVKKLKNDKEQDLALLDAKNSEVLSSQASSSDIVDVLKESEVPDESVINLTVNYLSKVARFKCHVNENFVTVFQDIADFFELEPTDFLLCLNDRNITISDSPMSLSISEHDILECIPYQIDETSEMLSEGDNTLKIAFQSNDAQIKIEMIVNKMERMQSIMERYAELRSLPLNELTFRFDGEKLFGTETPSKLDMDPDNCIDVTVTPPVPHSSKQRDDSPFASYSYDNYNMPGADSSYGNYNMPGADSSYGNDNMPGAGSSYGNDNMPVAGCSYGNMPVAGCSYGSNNYVPPYLQQFLTVESDSNDSDITMLN